MEIFRESLCATMAQEQMSLIKMQTGWCPIFQRPRKGQGTLQITLKARLEFQSTQEISCWVKAAKQTTLCAEITFKPMTMSVANVYSPQIH